MPDSAAPAAASAAPALTVTVGSASVTVDVGNTIKEGDNYYRLQGALTLPLDAAGHYDPAQMEGALASMTVMATQVEAVVAQAWLAKQASLRAERQRWQMLAKLTAELQGLCVPPADSTAALLEFFGGIPATADELRIALAKITAWRTTAERPEGWRWKVPVASKKPALPAPQTSRPA